MNQDVTDFKAIWKGQQKYLPRIGSSSWFQILKTESS